MGHDPTAFTGPEYKDHQDEVFFVVEHNRTVRHISVAEITSVLEEFGHLMSSPLSHAFTVAVASCNCGARQGQGCYSRNGNHRNSRTGTPHFVRSAKAASWKKVSTEDQIKELRHKILVQLVEERLRKG
jgi:hypothetical protein